jgi:predicted O-linked N-acetylglucosamine transferase (SPINDLY family)
MPQPTFQRAFNQALQHHKAGRLREAEQLYRKILSKHPKHAQAMHNLGVLANQIGRPDLALDLIRRTIALNPCFPDVHNNLGNALKDNGQLDEAIAAYRQAVALNPNFPEAHGNLGIALKCKGQLDQAIAAYRRAVVLQPNYPEVHKNLGNALKDNGQLDEAIAAYRQATILRPNYPEAHNDLGNALKDRGQLDQAIAAYRQAIVLNPNYPAAHSNLGNVLRDKGQLDQAIAAYRQAIVLNPNYPAAHSNLGNALRDNGQLDEAIAQCRQAIALNPNLSEAYSNLGNALKDKGQSDQAIAAYRQAIALKFNLPEAHYNLGIDPLGNSLVDDAIAPCRQALVPRPDYVEAHSNLLLALHYHPAYDPQAIAQEHRRWNQQHAEPLRQFIQPHVNDPSPERRLRIGYVSPDFRSHAVAQSVLPLLANHDREKFQVFCYAQVKNPDAMTERFRAHADQWRNTVGLSDEQMAGLIRQDQIDILVDLAGHTAASRLLVFARKPAPVQVTRQGYPNTTGLTAIDYRITDAHADPPGLSDTLHSEQLIRLPQTNWIFQPPEASPPPNQPPTGTPVTFGCFNNFAKVTEPMLMVWAQILKAVPGSRLLLKAAGLDLPDVQQRVRKIFQAQGISLDRLELMARVKSEADHLALHNQIAIALDPFPYHGTSTTHDAFWMGVPVITLAGQTHVSRVGVSLLTNLGLVDLIAQSPQEYIRIAAELAQDLPRLHNLRSTLRQRLEQSPLMDFPKFAQNIEAAYHQMWRTWCAQSSAVK